MPLGISKSIISCSGILSKYLIIAFKLSPWAVIKTFFPDCISGKITSLKYGMTLSLVSLKDSCKVKYFLDIFYILLD